MKKISIQTTLIYLGFFTYCWATTGGNIPITEMCYDDVQNTKVYALEYASALDRASDDSSKKAVSSVVLDIYWAKKLLTDFAPHTVPDTINDLADKLLVKMKKWLEVNGSVITDSVISNSRVKLHDVLSNKSPDMLGLGIYTFEKGKFSSGTWHGLDLTLNRDPGASATFQIEFEANMGGGFLAEGELKIQLNITGDSAVLAQKVVSITKVENGTSATVSGLANGKADCSCGIELQVGISTGTKIGTTQYWTNTNRTIVTLTADESRATCQ